MSKKNSKNLTPAQLGGLARARSLTAERRSAIARDAVTKRWTKSARKRSRRKVVSALVLHYIREFRDFPDIVSSLVTPLLPLLADDDSRPAVLSPDDLDDVLSIVNHTGKSFADCYREQTVEHFKREGAIPDVGAIN